VISLHAFLGPEPVEHRWKRLAPETMLAAGIYVHDGLVHLPYRRQDGSLHRTRVVASGRDPWWLYDGEGTILYGLDRLPFFEKELRLFVTEGETDCLAAREHGYQALGCPGARNFRPEWREVLEPFDLVYSIGDGDQAGSDFAWSVQRVVPWARPVVLPEGRDLRDLLQAGDQQQLHDLLDDADWLALTEWAVLSSETLEEAIGKVREAI
jgi:hypothetical protein